MENKRNKEDMNDYFMQIGYGKQAQINTEIA